MKMSEKFLFGLAVAVLAAGCVSTTTGPKKAEADDGEAADLLYQLGARYYRNGNYDLARDRLVMSIEKKPQKRSRPFNFGIDLRTTGQHSPCDRVL